MSKEPVKRAMLNGIRALALCQHSFFSAPFRTGVFDKAMSVPKKRIKPIISKIADIL